MALLSPDLRRGSVGWRDGDGAKQAAGPVTRLARSHHHPRSPHHPRWTLGWEAMGAAHRNTQQGHAGNPGLWCPQGGSGRGHEVALPARSPWTSNHRAPLAGAGAASSGAAKQMQDGATEPAVPPGTCWPGMPGHSAVTSPCSHHPCAGGPSDPQENQPSAVGCDPPGARPHPALPRARSVCSGCFHGSHQAPAEISCSRLGLSTQPFPGSPRLTSPHGWHCPTAGIAPPLASPCCLSRGSRPCLHPMQSVGVPGLLGKRDGNPKPAPNPQQSLPISHARPGRECAEAAPGGDRPCL